MSKKNPLLSSAGLTFDDFTHNARLLPAAAPLPVATVVPENQGSRGHSEEPKEDVRPALFGSPPPPVAAEASFSDISLEPSADQQQGSFLVASEPYNPLQGIDPYEKAPPNPSAGGESLFNPLAQAAQLKESLQHIPSVASTVFSTFSNILKGASGEQIEGSAVVPPSGQSQENTQNYPGGIYKSPLDAIYEQQLLNQTSQHHQQAVDQPPVSPLLFSPEDPSIARPPPSAAASAPPTTNTFRLGGHKKKTYAPVPGLSSGAIPAPATLPEPTTLPPNLPPFPVTAPGGGDNSQRSSVSPSLPPTTFYPTPQAANPYQNFGGATVPEQNKFSLSSFFSTPLLDRFQGKNSGQGEPVVGAEISSVDSVGVGGSFPVQPPPPQSSSQINPQFFNTNPIGIGSSSGFEYQAPPPPAPISVKQEQQQPSAPPTNTANPYSGYRLAKKTPSYKNTVIPETKTSFFVPQSEQNPPAVSAVNFFTPAPAPVPVVPTQSQPEPAELKIETKVSSPTIFKSTSEPVAAVQPDQAFFLPKTPTVEAPAAPAAAEKIPYTPEASHIDQLCTDLEKTRLPPSSSSVAQEIQQPTSSPLSFFDNNNQTSNWFDSNQNNSQLLNDHQTTLKTTSEEDVNKNQTLDLHASFFDCPPELKPEQQTPKNFFSFPKQLVDEVSVNNNSSLIVEKSSVASNLVSNGEEEESKVNAELVDSSMATSRSTPTGQETSSKSVTDAPAAAPPTGSYRPVYKHWFYRHKEEGKDVWIPFSMTDSLALEDAFMFPTAENVVIATDGGRHDVDIAARKRKSIYWTAEINEVRRCSWFYKAVDSRFVPYDEEIADFLEEEYKSAYATGSWHKQLTLPNGEQVNFHGPNVIVHFLQAQTPDAWGNTPQVTNRPRVVKRGVDEFNIEDGEPEQIDHVLFVVHGIGKACDFKFRTVEEVVDEFRSIALQMVQSHYRTAYDSGEIGRIEVLPISWHDELHSEESGIDAKLKSLTLESIPKLRNFTNDTLLDILFYTSPIFCQTIMDTVGGSINRTYKLFRERNPNFSGGVSLAGHSLGSLILFDLLCHQKVPSNDAEVENLETPDRVNDVTPTEPIARPQKQTPQQVNYTMGPAGTGQPSINYPQLDIKPKNFFAFGSPIGMFVTVRGIDTLGLDFKLPTCEGFYNIFHPYDIVAYRLEGLVNPELSSLRPVLIPHHKGRKRMHLELRETMVRVGGEIKQKIFDTFRSTVDTVTHLTSLGRTDPQAIKCEVDKVLEEQLHLDETQREINNSTTQSGSSNASDCDSGETDLPLGRLNRSRRIDYVLQEAPLEFFNEYIFALTSHVCYWQSEDTILFMVKEIYSSLGVHTDHKIPQQSLTIERPMATLPAR